MRSRIQVFSRRKSDATLPRAARTEKRFDIEIPSVWMYRSL